MKTQHFFIDLTQRPPQSFRVSKTLEDLKTLTEFGELDDHVSFGGKA